MIGVDEQIIRFACLLLYQFKEYIMKTDGITPERNKEQTEKLLAKNNVRNNAENRTSRFHFAIRDDEDSRMTAYHGLANSPSMDTPEDMSRLDASHPIHVLEE